MRERLAEFDTELVEGIDVPNGPHREHLVLIERNQSPERERVQLAMQDDRRGTVAGEGSVRCEAVGLRHRQPGTGLRFGAAEGQRRALRQAIGEQ